MRTNEDMRAAEHTRTNDTSARDANRIFEDPVAYLAGFGLQAEVVTETFLPAAA